MSSQENKPPETPRPNGPNQMTPKEDVKGMVKTLTIVLGPIILIMIILKLVGC